MFVTSAIPNKHQLVALRNQVEIKLILLIETNNKNTKE